MKKLMSLLLFISSSLVLSTAMAAQYPAVYDAYVTNNTDYPVHLALSNYNQGKVNFMFKTIPAHSANINFARASIVNGVADNSYTVHLGDAAMDQTNTALVEFHISYPQNNASYGSDNGGLMIDGHYCYVTHQKYNNPLAIPTFLHIVINQND